MVALAIKIPSLLGARLYLGISEAIFRKFVLSLRICTGVAPLVSSEPGLIWRLAQGTRKL
jgi:hypothetical protein